MWVYERRVRISDTDATGAIFFGAAFDIAVEVFEEWLHFHGVKLHEDSFLLPVVHAEADYKARIQLGDLVLAQFCIKKIGVTSFTTEVTLKVGDKIMGVVYLTHVSTLQSTGHKIEVPALLRHLLEREVTSKI